MSVEPARLGSAERPAVYTVAPGMPFTEALAVGLIGLADGEAEVLARMTVLIPTRRAVRALREAFLRAAGGEATLLPRLQPIGDVDEDEIALGGAIDGLDLPPAVPELRRRLALARIIRAYDKRVNDAEALWLAAELAHFLDQVQTERLDLAALGNLVPEELSGHWQQTLEFLRILSREWPAALDAMGALDPAERRNRLLAAQIEAWRERPPPGPVVAAGSTGSIPATADLLAFVAHAPWGAVVLPGLDRRLDDEAWGALDQTHPQYGLRLLLDRIGIDREAVDDWPHGPTVPAPARAALVSDALRPAPATGAWREGPLGAAEARAALEGVSRIEAPTQREEAAAIALVLRGALEHGPEDEPRTAALVTPDRALARRVAAELGRWEIDVDDSGGQPLAQTPPGAFLRLTAAAVGEGLAPVPLLALLKHPLAAGGGEPAYFRSQVRALERLALRGPRPAPGVDGLRAALEAAASDEHVRKDDLPPARKAIAAVEGALAPMIEAMDAPTAPLDRLVAAHVAAAEALAAAGDAPGAVRLWAGEAGEVAADFVADVVAAAGELPPMAPRDYPAALDALMAGRTVRPRFGRHPRLHIWGPLEARLQSADVMVLGGLNEGGWPPEPETDPWMSRPMRRDFGLPQPERRVGLSAHDFAQAVCAPTVVLTRARRVEGAPAVPSRWLLRLDAVLDAAGLGDERWPGGDWLDWMDALDAKDDDTPGPMTERPLPRPKVEARPRKLSVTQIGTWMRDPYAIYARRILRLEPLDPIDAAPGGADRGKFIHDALEAFLRDVPGQLPDDALQRLLAAGHEAFAAALDRPGVWAFWWPRFERIAKWVIERERERRPALVGGLAEVRGELPIDAPAGEFLLTAKADRIDRRADGAIDIIDYKTGAVPTAKQVDAGFEPQLPLEAAIARGGGFERLGKVEVASLQYWRLRGGAQAGSIEQAGKDAPEDLAEAALDGLAKLIAKFDDPATPYAPIPRAAYAPRFNDYAHLARIAEWSAAGGEDAE